MAPCRTGGCSPQRSAASIARSPTNVLFLRQHPRRGRTRAAPAAGARAGSRAAGGGVFSVGPDVWRWRRAVRCGVDLNARLSGGTAHGGHPGRLGGRFMTPARPGENYGPWRSQRLPLAEPSAEARTRRETAVQNEGRRGAGPGSHSPPHQPQREGDIILGRAPQRPITAHLLPPAGPAR